MAPIRFAVPGSVKTLRGYWKDKLAVPDATHFRNELTGESDRSFVILIATIVDDVLTIRLTNHISQILQRPMDAQDFEHIFRFEGPLGSFSARIEIAYWFGLIEPRLRCQLDDLRELRNACAHSKREISFRLSVLANAAKRLFKPNGCFSPGANTPESIRDTIYAEVLVMYKMLGEAMSRDAAREQVRKDFAKFFAAYIPSPDKSPQQ